jgi:S1-C subfamily serine protease
MKTMTKASLPMGLALIAACAALLITSPLPAPQANPAPVHQDGAARAQGELPAGPTEASLLMEAIAMVQNGSLHSTGFVITPDGMMLTTAHSVRAVDHVSVVINGRTIIADVLRVHRIHDLAVIKTRDPGPYASLQLAYATTAPGGHVRHVGYPDGNLTAATGKTPGRYEEERAIYSTAPSQPGHSGSPMLNSMDQVIGVVHRGNARMTFAVETHWLHNSPPGDWITPGRAPTGEPQP